MERRGDERGREERGGVEGRCGGEVWRGEERRREGERGEGRCGGEGGGEERGGR